MPFIETSPINRPAKHIFRPIQLRRPKSRQDTSSQDEPAEDTDRGLYCSACSTRITDQDQAVSVNGRHQRAFFNPAGIAFEIRCFQNAPGTLPSGPPSEDFSWFPGYAWQIVLCSTCQAHLGWKFSAVTTAQQFFALIASRLVSR